MHNPPTKENGMEFMARSLQVLRRLHERLVFTPGVQNMN
jgi:hypothetical protein